MSLTLFYLAITGNSHKNFVDANLRVLTKRIEALRRKEKAHDEGWSYIKRGYDHQKHKHGKINDMLSASTEVVKLFVSGIVLALITCSLSLFLVSLVIRVFTL